MFQFEGKVAVITGAASGFGQAFAEKGASLGMKLVLADIDATALAQTVDALRAAGAEAIGVRPTSRTRRRSRPSRRRRSRRSGRFICCSITRGWGRPVSCGNTA